MLGETCEGFYNDGTKTYSEQISNHPPYLFSLALGPKNSYKYYASYKNEAKAGINSMKA